MILPKQKRIIVLGDLHGDLNSTLYILRKTKLINLTFENNEADIKWIGGDTILIQVGDQIDRAPRLLNGENNDENSDLKIISMFDDLDELAKLSGGRVISLLGNHEIMNVLGDFSYVSKAGLFKERRDVFKPGGFICSKFFCKRPVMCKIGSWIFCHGGIHPNIAKKYKIDDINKIMYDFLMGKVPPNVKIIHELFLDSKSILWNREYSGDKINYYNARKTLGLLNAKGMIMGHTPYRDEGINSRMKNKLWRVDCGISRAFGPHVKDSEFQYLEIINDGEIIRVYK